MKNFFRWVQVIGVVLVSVIFVLIYYFIYSSPYLLEKSYVFEIKKGESFSKISERLEQKKFIRSSLALKILGALRNKSKHAMVGEFLIAPKMSSLEILNLITEGNTIEYIVTVPEGTNIYELANLLRDKKFVKKEEFLKLCHDQDFIKELLGEPLYSLEGYLYPETYHYTKQTTPKELIKAMVQKFLSVYKNSLSGIVKLPRHEHVILASIIEKETGYRGERGLVSSVFHNRLRIPMRLQTDPTILYGMTVNSGGVIFKNIRRKDILEKTEYNTYQINGLPKGPISNPGKKALRAAVNPLKSDFLYFVSRNNGTHAFSKTFKEHNNYVKEFQLGLQKKRKKKIKKNNP